MKLRRASRTFVDEMCARTAMEVPPPRDLTADGRVAVVAHWAPAPRVSRSTARLIGELSAGGYRCVLVSTAAGGPLEWTEPPPPGTTVLRRANEGYDFGSWAVALAMLPEIRGCRFVLLTNDSMAGPFAPLAPLLAAFEEAPTDVWAATDSHQIRHHIQSYLVGFHGGILEERAWRRFFGGIRHHEEKMDIVMRYEMGLIEVCRREGYPWSVQFRALDLGVGHANPTLAGWRTLLVRGFPFVKRTIITDPSTAPEGELVGEVLRRKYGVELPEWL